MADKINHEQMCTIMQELTTWLDKENIPAPDSIHVNFDIEEVAVAYKLEDLYSPDRRYIKGKFGKFIKNTFSGDIYSTAVPFPIMEECAIREWHVRVRISGAYECRTVCTPVDHEAAGSLSDFGVTD